MHFAKLHRNGRIVFCFALAAAAFPLSLPLAYSQDSASDPNIPRADRPRLSITVRDSGGAAINSAGLVKLYRDGMLFDQTGLSHGRAFFDNILFGDYTLEIDATGYKPAQRDVNVSIAMLYEIEANLQRDTAPDGAAAVAPAKPLLAPKAKEALEKCLKALSSKKLAEAQKYLDEALKLAPGHPDVLYAQGLLLLDQRNWTQAQSVLEKASQMDPTNAHAFSSLGMAFVNDGKYGQAIAPLEKALQLDRAAWEPQWMLGESYYRLQQYDQALKASQTAWTESNGKEPRIELLLAESLTAVGKYEDAAQALRDFLKRYGDRPEASKAQRWLDGLARNGKIHSN